MARVDRRVRDRLVRLSVRLIVPAHYTPREQFSPSQLELLATCGHKWGLRYLRGIKEADERLNWEEVCHLARPPKPKPTASYHTIAMLREELQEYNRKTRRALGHALHHVNQVHYDWHPPLAEVDWDDRPAVLYMAGLHLLPSANDCDTLWLEEEVSFDVGPRADPLLFFGFIDLVAKLRNGRWRLYDLKSTYSFNYCKTPAELRDDVQACFYALAIMIEQGLDELECRWVYFLTDETKKPDARGVDFTITREHAERILRPHTRRALQAREAMRARAFTGARTFPVLDFNVLSCDQFGGCLHKDSRFCRPPKASKGALLSGLVAQKDLLRKRREALKSEPSGTVGGKALAAPSRVRTSAPHSQKKDT